MRPPPSRTCRISSAMPAINTFLGFSAETSLPMKLKISVWRERSSGVTRTPWCPITTSIPGLASWKTIARAACRAVDRGRGVHLEPVDVDPLPAQEDLRRQVARGVEAFGKDPFARDLVQANGLLVLCGRAQRPRPGDDLVEQRRRVRVDLHAADGRIRLVLPDLQLLDGEVAPEVHDEVHDLGQHHRVDDVALQDQARGVPSLGHARTPAAALIWAWSAAASRAGLSA